MKLCYAPVCFLLNSAMASLKAGSDFVALRASMNSFHSGVSEIGLRRFTAADLVSSDVPCILLHQQSLSEITFINVSISNKGLKGCMGDN